MLTTASPETERLLAVTKHFYLKFRTIPLDWFIRLNEAGYVVTELERKWTEEAHIA